MTVRGIDFPVGAGRVWFSAEPVELPVPPPAPDDEDDADDDETERDSLAPVVNRLQVEVERLEAEVARQERIAASYRDSLDEAHHVLDELEVALDVATQRGDAWRDRALEAEKGAADQGSELKEHIDRLRLLYEEEAQRVESLEAAQGRLAGALAAEESDAQAKAARARGEGFAYEQGRIDVCVKLLNAWLDTKEALHDALTELDEALGREPNTAQDVVSARAQATPVPSRPESSEGRGNQEHLSSAKAAAPPGPEYSRTLYVPLPISRPEFSDGEVRTSRIGRVYQGDPPTSVAGWDTWKIEDGNVSHVSFEPNPDYTGDEEA